MYKNNLQRNTPNSGFKTKKDSKQVDHGFLRIPP